jgi:lysophospholipase L1-like esterase
MKCVLIGNSVSLRVRPKLESEENLVFGSLLNGQELKDGSILSVKNFGFSRLLITEAFKQKDIYIREFPDLFIINIGCVDAPYRDISLWISNIIFFRKNSIFYKPIRFLYDAIIKRYSNFFVYARFLKPWVSRKSFKFHFDGLLTSLKKETNAKIIVLGINSGNSIIDKKLPYTSKQISVYNSILNELTEIHNVDFVSVSELNSTDHFPDGVHYNNLGHRIISQKILNII